MSRLISEVDNMVRSLVPCFFEAAGLRVEADKLRATSPLKTREAVVAVCDMLRGLSHGELPNIRDASWVHHIHDVAFWSEASIWVALSNDATECHVCLLQIKQIMDVAWSRFTTH